MGHRYARFLAICVIFLQATLPGTISYAQSRGFDISDLICITPGELSSQSLAGVQRLAELLDDEAPSHVPGTDHCSLCTIVHGATLPTRVDVSLPILIAFEDDFVRFEPGLVRTAQGPPTGSRAPPTTI